MSSQTNTLYVVIDPSGAQQGANATVNAINSIIQSSTQLNVSINQTINNVQQLGNASRDTNQLRSAVRSLTDDFKGLAGVVAAAQPIRILSSFIDEIVRADRLYNGFIAMMNVTTGNVQKSREEFEFVAKVARTYGVQIDSLTHSYAKLRASTENLLTEDQTKKLFMSITAVSSVMHAEKYVVDRMFAAIVQMASKGQIHMEELKQQLGEHLPGALAIAAQAMGMSVADMIKAMENGQISAKRLLLPLPDELMKRFEAAAEISAKSLHATISRLKSSVMLAFMNMSTNGAALGLSAIFIELEKHVGTNSAAFKTLGEVMGRAFVRIAEFIAKLTPEDVETFANSVIDLVIAIGTMGEWFAKAITFIVQYNESILIAVGALAAIKVAMYGYAIAASATAGANTLLGTSISFIGASIAALGAFVAGYAIGTIIHDEFEPVRNAAAWTVGFFAKLPLHAKRGFDETILNVKLFGAQFSQYIVEAAMWAVNDVKNMGGSIARLLGFDVPVFIPKRYDETTNAIRKQLDGIRKEYRDGIAEIDAIVNSMYESNAGKKPKAEKRSVASMLGIDLREIEDAKSLYAKLQGDSDKFADALNGKKDKASKSENRLDEFQRLIDLSTDGTTKLLQSEKLYYNTLHDIREGKIQMSTAEIGRLAILADQAIAMERAAVATAEQIKLDKEAAQATAYMTESLSSMIDTYEKRNAKTVESTMTKQEREYAEALRETSEIAQRARDAISKKAASINESSAAYAAYQTVLEQVNAAEQAQLALEAENFEKKKAAQSSFFEGFNKAVLKYRDSAESVATSVEGFFTKAFKGMEDALVSFVQTGKIDMTNFANSVIADIIRIQVRAAMMAAASSSSGGGFLGTLINGVVGWFAGGTTTAPSTTGPSAVAGGGSWLGDTSGYSLNAKSFDGGGYTGDDPRSGGIDGKGGFWAVMHPQESVIDHTKGQSASPQSVRVEIRNEGTPQEVSDAKTSFDAEGMIIEFLTRDVSNEGPVSKAFQNRYGLSRAAGAY